MSWNPVSQAMPMLDTCWPDLVGPWAGTKGRERFIDSVVQGVRPLRPVNCVRRTQYLFMAALLCPRQVYYVRPTSAHPPRARLPVPGSDPLSVIDHPLSIHGGDRSVAAVTRWNGATSGLRRRGAVAWRE